MKRIIEKLIFIFSVIVGLFCGKVVYDWHVEKLNTMVVTDFETIGFAHVGAPLMATLLGGALTYLLLTIYRQIFTRIS